MTRSGRGLLLFARRRRTTTSTILTILFTSLLLLLVLLRPLSIHSFTPPSRLPSSVVPSSSVLPSSSTLSSPLTSPSLNSSIRRRHCLWSGGAFNRLPFGNNDNDISRRARRTSFFTSQSLHSNRSNNINNNNNDNMEIRASSAGDDGTPASSSSSATATRGAIGGGDIPTFDPTNEKSKATDYANYFCAYAQLYHQKQMLTDHNRMAAYHAAIVGNANVFKDKVVMDVGTGSGILAGTSCCVMLCWEGKKLYMYCIIILSCYIYSTSSKRPLSSLNNIIRTLRVIFIYIIYSLGRTGRRKTRVCHRIHGHGQTCTTRREGQ